ncbi:hypothetical protein F5148DRAFT_927232 [Russula earlei]|uniref:Uncharacterized protein n=1 Tax=Russula earlei TaxID=71964 RepID=A0ACC0UB20_9AGAM|nr:hypothetical protein F5148DRAFT_927232 [Russula earlei]
MSHVSSSSADPDIWEFVTCSKCHLPFSSGPSVPPQVPFWLTECGHVICNLHLNADQSCCECGAQRIQMIPLQRDLDNPMSNWFCSVPHSMDTITYSIKFQQDMLMSLIRFLREKITQQRDVLLRVKQEREELKGLRKIVEDLRTENEQLRLYAGLDGNRSYTATNSSGKRRRIDAYNSDSRNLSSPRSVITPLGPNRLTLPADHPPAALGQRFSQTTSANLRDSLQPGRPQSSRLQQFAYDSSHTPRQSGVFGPHKGTSNPHLMPPPPPVDRENAARAFPSVGTTHRMSSHARGDQGDVSQAQQLLPDAAFVSTASHRTAPDASNRFTPRASTSHTPSSAKSRFVPQTPDSRRFVPATNSAGSRVQSGAGTSTPALHSGQRAPFFSGTRMG